MMKNQGQRDHCKVWTDQDWSNRKRLKGGDIGIKTERETCLGC